MKPLLAVICLQSKSEDYCAFQCGLWSKCSTGQVSRPKPHECSAQMPRGPRRRRPDVTLGRSAWRLDRTNAYHKAKHFCNTQRVEPVRTACRNRGSASACLVQTVTRPRRQPRHCPHDLSARHCRPNIPLDRRGGPPRCRDRGKWPASIPQETAAKPWRSPAHSRKRLGPAAALG